MKLTKRKPTALGVEVDKSDRTCDKSGGTANPRQQVAGDSETREDKGPRGPCVDSRRDALNVLAEHDCHGKKLAAGQDLPHRTC